MLVNGGMSQNQALNGMNQDIAEKIARSLSFIEIKKTNNNIISF